VFDAFISYSHAADGKLAAALQHGLHRFAKPLFKRRAIRVFRDESTLAMTPQIWPEIEKALRSSRFFILMADPLSAQSEWVQKEVACWVAMKRTEKMLIVWTGGDLVWDKARKDFAWDKTTALPNLLARTFEGEEPLYQDLRWAREEVHLSRKHPQFASALAKLSAAIRGQSLDEIFGEDVREQRRSLRFLWAGITILLLAILLASWGWRAEFQARNAADEQTRIANEQRIKAEEQTRIAEEQARIANVRRLVAESASAFGKYPQRGLLLAVEAARVVQSLHGDRVAAAEQSLREALAFIGGRPVARADGPITAVAIRPDNRWLVSGSDDKTVRLWDLSAKDPAAKLVVLRGHDGRVNAVAISPDNRWLVSGGDDETARLWDLSAKDPAAKPVVLRGHDHEVWAVAIRPG
jgi:WD domain, G-beta repeat/TIR domain